MQQKKPKISVVGAGPGGLTAAMILQHRGFDVTVYEKADRVGGRNRRLQLGDFTFDLGPTFLMMKFVLDEIFAEVGEKTKDHIETIKLDPMYCLNFIDQQVVSRSRLRDMQSQVNRLFPGDMAGLQRFQENEKRRFKLLFPCLQKDYTHFTRFFSPEFLRALPVLGVGRSLFGNLGRYFKHERLKLSFTFQAKYLGMSPWECPAGFTIIPYIEHAFGIYHVTGGLNKISEAMAEIIRQKSGKIKLKSGVKRLIVEDGKVLGLELEDGKKVYSDEVVINADFAHAMTKLVKPGLLKKYSRKKLEKKKFSCSTFMLYLGLNKQFALPHHNIYFAKDYRRNVEEIFKDKTVSEDISLYIQNASVTDPTLAPKGKSALYILVPAPNNASRIDWDAHRAEYIERIYATIEKRVPELKGLRDAVEVEQVITPSDWEENYGVYQGATFNLAHNLRQMLYFRPRNKFEELEQCYLVGGGTHPGSGLPTIYESARITANLLSKKYGVTYDRPTTLDRKHVE